MSHSSVMDRAALAQRLRDAVIAAVVTFRDERPAEHPYAFAIIGGQAGNYVGFAAATEEGLRATATKYGERGYRYEGWEWEHADNVKPLSVWLRWAGPDEGWHYGDFDDSESLCHALRELFARGVLRDEDGSFESFCADEVLEPLSRDRNWSHDPLSATLILGFTYGDDARDFLRSATRANPYPRVLELWRQHWQAEELNHRIRRP